MPSKVQAYDGLSDLLGDVFRELTGKKKRGAPVAIPARRFPQLPAAQLEARRERLIAFGTAQKHWIDVHCQLSKEQSLQLDALFLAEVDASQERLKTKNNRNQNAASDFMPVRFTTIDGAASESFKGKTWERKIHEVLNEQQVQSLQKAQQEREQHLIEAQRLWVLNLLDRELYFTKKQRDGVLTHLETRMKPKSFQLYSLSNQNYYLKYQQPHSLLANLPTNVLNPPQKDRLERVRNGNVRGSSSERYISFRSNDGAEGWYSALDEAVEKQSERLKGIAEVQIRYYEHEYQLDQAAVEHLQLAAKGTVLYCISDWKESTKKNLRRWEERMQQQQFGNGNFSFSVSVPAVSTLDRHQLWKNALSGLAVDSNKISSEREERQRELSLAYILYLFDTELWLSQDQRQKLAELFEKELPKSQISGYEYIYEIVLMSAPLVSCKPADLKKILDEEQLEAWDVLSQQYQINGRHVTIHMQNNGQFSFNIPK